MAKKKQEMETNARSSSAKLPKLKITPFKGTPADWVRFENMFAMQIHNKPKSDEEKFGYLLEMVSPKVRERISNLRLSTVGYTVAWERLEKEFGQTKLVVTTHIDKIINLPVIKGTNYDRVKEFYENTLMWGQNAHPLEGEEDEDETSALNKRLKETTNHAWKRWRHEYVQSLLEGHQIYHKTAKVPDIGEIVLVVGDEKNQGEWKKGTFEGKTALSKEYRYFTRLTTLIDHLTSCAQRGLKEWWRASEKCQKHQTNQQNGPESEDKQLRQLERRSVESLQTRMITELCLVVGKQTV